MLKGSPPVRWLAVCTVAWMVLRALPMSAQVAPSPPPAANQATLEEAVKTLAGEVRELNSTIQELRAEVSESRQETSRLRQEMNGALERLGPTGVAANRQAALAVSAPSAELNHAASSTVESPSDARLDKLVEDQQLLQAKVDEQHQTKLESASKYRVKLSGIALLNLFGNSGAVDNQDVPNLALAPGASGANGSVGATVRQSEIGLETYGPTAGGGQVSGNVNFDFMGGFSNVANGVTESVVRLRTATMRIDWARTSLVGGQDAPFFSPLSPSSFASLGYPAFADAGNLWTWTPQVRVEHRLTLSEADGLLVQAGILDPLSGEPPDAEYYRTPDAGERSRIPAAGTRLAWTHGVGDHALTLGVGGYYSRQSYGAGRTTDAWAGTADWNAPLGSRFVVSGEFYRGRAIGGLGGAEDRSVLFNGQPTYSDSEMVALDTIGGWAQLKFKASPTIEFNAAYGQDNPFAKDLRYFDEPVGYGYTSIAKNQNALLNIIFRPRSDLLFGLEYRYLDTFQTANRTNTAGIINISMGVLF
jgi:hypothetical protein